MLRAPLAGLAFLLASLPAVAQEPSIAADLEACRADPRFRVGGAMHGQCLQEIAAGVEAVNEVALRRLGKRFCGPAERETLDTVVRTAAAADRAVCDLMTETPGNTPSYINGSACRLIAARQNAEQLRLMTAYINPRCRGLALEPHASRFGEPDDDVRELYAAGLAWRVERAAGEFRLLVLREGTEISRRDLADCSFCNDPEDNCAEDGIFALSGGAGSVQSLMFHVCHVGAHSQRLVLFDPLAPADADLLRVTGSYFVSWRIDDGALVIEHDGEGEKTLHWPPR
jgi:hypothetical protein